MTHVQPFVVGSVEIFVMCQGFAPLLLSDECPGRSVDWDLHRRRHPWAFLDEGSWLWHVHGFAVHGPSGVVMVDTGTGAFPPFVPWTRSREPESAYRDAHIDPDEVDVVVMTHLHADHAGGGLTDGGEPRFPNARYVVHPADWAFFADADDHEDYTARHALDRVNDLDMLDLAESDREVVPGIAVVHSPGHTPGHRSVVVTGTDGSVLLTGDLLHLPIQAENPSWSSSHDEDPATAATSRTALLGEARELGWTIGVSHFAEPFGSLTPDGWVSASSPPHGPPTPERRLGG
jgi:glyoxylase-like metal-dependent hydrolase (beta-lactamase superfamily II)